MRNFVIIDDSDFPVVVSRYQDFIPSWEEFLKAQTDLENYYAAHTDFVMIIDLSNVKELPSEYRISQGKWSKKNTPLAINNRIKFSFFTPSLTQRLMVKTVLTVSRVGAAYSISSTFEKAYSWAKHQCAVN